jgi:hypothetical protein
LSGGGGRRGGLGDGGLTDGFDKEGSRNRRGAARCGRPATVFMPMAVIR